jgi:hypothetical protein
MGHRRPRCPGSITLLVIVSTLWPVLAWAQAPAAGVVTTIQGQATVARPVVPQPIPLKFKDDLFVRDRIETREDSIVRALLGGKALVTIRELSVFTLSEEPGRATVELNSGRAALGVAKSLLRPGEVIEIRTPNAVAGVRGSLLVAEVTLVGGVPQTTFTALQVTLPILVSSVARPGITVSLNANQAVGIAGLGAAAVVGPVQNITPAQARDAARATVAPKPAAQSASTPLAGQISADKMTEAAELASLFTPASSATVAPPVTTTAAPSTASLGVNATAATTGAETIAPAQISPPGTPLVISGQTLTLGGSLLQLGAFTSTIAGPLVQIDGSTVSETGTTAALLLIAPNGLTSTMTGPLFSLTGSSITSSGPTFDFQGPGGLSSTTTGPLISSDPSSLTSAQQIILVDGFTLSLTGSLLQSQDTSFATTSDQFSFFALTDGASVTTSATTDPLLKFTGTASGLSKVTAARNFLPLSITASGNPAPSMTLSGPLLSASHTDFKTGDPNANTFSFLFVGDSSALTSTSTSPLLSFDSSTVDTSGSFLSLRRSSSPSSPSRLMLSGPLFVATNGSSFNTSSLGFGATFATSGQACCSGFSVSQGAQLSSTTPLPLIQLTNSTFSAGPDAQSGSHFFSLADSGPPDGITAPASVSLAGPLLSVAGSTISALFSLLRVSDSSFASTSADPLIQLNASTVSVGGIDPFTNATSTARLLSLSGTGSSPATLSLRGPLFSATNANITTTSEPFGIFAGGSLTTTGTAAPLISFSGGTVKAGNHLVHVRGFATGGSIPASVNLSDPLLSENGTTFNVSGNLLRLTDAGSLSSTTTQPLISLTGGSFTGPPAGSSLGGSLLRMFSEAGQSGSLLSLVGPYLVSSGTVYNAPDASAFNIADGAVIHSSSTAPFASFSGGSLSTPSSTLISLASNTSFTVPGQPTTVGSGVSPIVTLTGPLFLGTNTSITSGNPTANTSGLMFIGDSSVLASTTTSPLLSFDGSTANGGFILTLRRSTSVAAPSTLVLAGPLFSAVNGSTFTLGSSAFGQTFGTAPAACCDAFFIGQGAQLSSTSAQPLILLTNSTLNAGPNTNSGGDVIGVFNTFTGAPAAELVAPASLVLSGPLFSVTGGSVSALFSLLNIGRSSVTSATGNPLINLSNTTVSLGGLNPINNAITIGRLVNVVSSATAGTSASPASLSLTGTGPLLSAANSSLTLTGDVVGVFNGATLTSDAQDFQAGIVSSTPLIQLSGGTTLTTGTTSINGRLLNVSGTGGSDGTSRAEVIMAGPLLSSVASTLNLSGGLVAVSPGGRVSTGVSTVPFTSITGGTHAIASNAGTQMFGLVGSSTAVDPQSGLTLGTDRPIRGATRPDGTQPLLVPLLQTSGATVTGQQVLRIDTALFEATAPLLNLVASSGLTTSVDAINLNNRANVSMLGSDLVRLDASTLSVSSGALARVAGSKLTLGGNFLTMVNGATLNLFSGPLLNVLNGGFVSITGALVNFGGTGGNLINVQNTLVPTGFINGVPVFSSLGGTNGYTVTNSTPLVGLNSLGTIKINGTTLPSGATSSSGVTGSLIAIQGGGGTVKIGP